MAEEADKKSNKLTPDFVKHLMMQDFKGQQSLANKEYNFQLQFLEAFCDISNQCFFTEFQSMYESQHVTDGDIKQMFHIYQENIRALITLRDAYVDGNIAKKDRKRDEDEFFWTKQQLQEIKEENRKAQAELDSQLHRDIFGTRQQVTNAYIIKRS